MDNKEDELLKMASEYMDYLEELLGEPGHEGYVVDLVNDIHMILTGEEEPIMDVKYINPDVVSDYGMEEEDWLDEDWLSLDEYLESNKGKPKQREVANYSLGNVDTKGERVADSFEDLLDTFEDLLDNIDHLEHDKEYLVEKNAALVGQATQLVLDLGKKDDHIKSLQKTIESIFKKGDNELNSITFEKVERIEEDIKLPERSTKASAGYDFYAIEDIEIPGKSDEGEHKATLVKTGIKAKFPDDVVLNLYSRSSMAVKNGIILVNGVGVIDADYYGNESNDGEIMFAYVNSTTEPYKVTKGDRIGQGVFHKYLTVTEDNAQGTRTGGVGSTGK